MVKDELYTIDEVMPRPKGINTDSVKERHSQDAPHFDKHLLGHGERAYNNLDSWRKMIDRCVKFLRGEQWSDEVWTPFGWMKEEDVMVNDGNAPIVVNMLFSLYTTITGLHAKQETEPVAFARGTRDRQLSKMMSSALKCNWQNTDMPTLTDDGFGTLFVAGGVFARESYEERDQLFESWSDFPHPYSMFFEGGDDPRSNNFSLIGQLHDMTAPQLFHMFAKPEYNLTIDKLRKMYHIPENLDMDNCYTDYRQQNDYLNRSSYYQSSKPQCYRVIEIWKEECKERVQCFDPLASTAEEKWYRREVKDIHIDIEENRRRQAQYDAMGVPVEKRAYIQGKYISDLYWHYEFLTPDGYVLCEGESPYDFHSHPYTACFYPQINGEPVSCCMLYIDLQKDVNRMKALMDKAVRTAIKGITFLPLSLKPDGMSVEEYRAQKDLYGGTYVYDDMKPNRSGAKPEFFANSAFNIGQAEMLQISLNLLHEVSNISGAIQGKSPAAGTSGASYAMQSQNATTSLYACVKKYAKFKERLTMKKCMMIQQYMEDGRDISFDSQDEVLEYNREAMRDLRFRVSIQDSPANYDAVNEEWLKGLVGDGIATAKEYLKHSKNPLAQEILIDVEAREQAMAEGQQFAQPIQVPGADQQLVQQAQAAMAMPAE